MALSNPIKFFNAHDKKMKNADANNEVSSPNCVCVCVYLVCKIPAFVLQLKSGC